MKKWIALLLCLSLFVGLIGCSTKTEEPKADPPAVETDTPEVEAPAENESEAPEEDSFEGSTVTMMITQANYKDSYQTIVEKIEEAEGISVDIQVLPDDQYYESIRVKMTTGEVPDIFMVTVPDRYVDVNAAETCVMMNDQPWVDRLVNPSVVLADDGNIYSMPIASNAGMMAMCYNKEVLAAAGYENPNPQTWEEFIEILDAIKAYDSEITPVYMSNADAWTTQIWTTAGLSVMLGDKAEEVYAKVSNNELKLADVPEFAQLLADFKSLFENGYTNVDNFSATYDMATAAVASGKAAMYLTVEAGVNVIASLTDPDNVGLFAVPFGDHDAISINNGSTGFLVPKDAENKDAALKVLDLLSQPEYLNIYYAENPGQPGFVDVDGGALLGCIADLSEAYVNTGKWYNQMNSELNAFSAVQSQWWGYYGELIADVKTVDEVVAAVDATNEDYMRTAGVEGW